MINIIKIILILLAFGLNSQKQDSISEVFKQIDHSISIADFEKANSEIDTLLKQANPSNNYEHVKANYYKAMLFMLEDKNDSAVFYFTKCDSFSRALNIPEFIAKSNDNLGTIYCEKNEFNKALLHLKIAKKIYQDSLKDSSLLEINLSNTALVFANLDSCEGIYSILFKDQLIKFNNNQHVNNIIGNYYFNCVENYDSSIYYYKKALLSSDSYFVFGKQHIYSNIGVVFSVMGERDSAKINLMKGYSIASSLNDRYMLHHVSEILSEIYKNTGNSDSTKKYAKISQKNENQLFESGFEKSLLLNIENHLPPKKTDLYRYIILISIITLALILIYFWNKYDKRILHEKQIEIIEEITEKAHNQLSKYFISFEKKLHFLNPSISMEEVSQDANTNSKVISNYFEDIHQTNFVKYISEKRINYIIELYKSDDSLRDLSKMDIAKKAGYISIESFESDFKNLYGESFDQFINDIHGVDNV